MGQNAKATARACRFCCLLLMVCLLSCSSTRETEPSGNEPISTTQFQTLAAAPVTIRLSVPNPVSPIAPVIQATNSVSFGPFANVISGMTVAMSASGGTLHSEPDALLNETWSRGVVDFKQRVQVRGILHSKFPPALDAGMSITVGGLDTNPLFDPPSTLAWNVIYPSTTPGPDANAFFNEQKTFGPGQYSTINASSGGTLTLLAGTYYIKTLTVENTGLLRLDQAAGPVIIYVTDFINFHGPIRSVSGAPPDLLIAYIGTNDINIDAQVDGALITPFAKLTLHTIPSPGIYTGFFMAKDFSDVDSQVRIQYRAPLAIVAAAKPTGPTCRQMIAPLVPAAQLPALAARYCGGCFEDTDRDGLPDCMDKCPYDATKTEPGVCGCGVPETDTDGDGFPDCVDEQCQNDPNNTTLGQCGCVGQPGIKPAGTPCTDVACAQGAATCNGAGVCGSRSSCSPGNNCKLIEHNGIFYYICGERFPTGTTPAPDAGTSPPAGQLAQTPAQNACSAKGMSLAHIETLSQDRFLQRFLTTPAWIGANDLTTANTWRWALPSNLNGDTFWQGAATGAPVNNLFSNWGVGAPGSQKCAMMRPDGQWFDADCSEAAGYICEFRRSLSRPVDAGLGPGIGPTGMPGQPRPRGDGSAGQQSICLTEPEAGLPTDAAVLQQQIALARQDVFVGAAASPPPANSICPPDDLDAAGIGLHLDAGEGCSLINIRKNAQGVPIECIQQSDCAQFGAGFLCRQVKDDPNCTPDASVVNGVGVPTDAGICRGHAVCAQVSCPPNPFPNRCNQVEVCGPIPDTVANGPDPGSNLDAESFVPAQLFEAGIPPATPSTQYSDDPIRGDAGKNHSWCFMQPQNANAIAPATQQAKNKKGTSGASSVITFGFDPDLVFDVKTPQLPLGLPNPSLHAAAKFVAKVSLNNFLGQRYSANIIDVAADVKAGLCDINDTDTHFQVLGLDFIAPGDLPLFDTKTSDFSKNCAHSLDTFVVWANRAKKAFRDAQQLVGQYKSLNGLLSGDLCKQIGVIGADIPGFPGGNVCYANEPVEITINRFLDYYQGPGGGQIAQLKNAAKSVTDSIHAVVAALKGQVRHDFGNFNREESHTIVNVPFAIGPVPMLLQIDAFAEYGIAGGFALNYNLDGLFNLDGDPTVDPNVVSQINPPPDTVASVSAQVVPHASAGLSAFVAAGFSLGPFSAAVGLEGAVSLAEVAAPIYAGVGLGATVTRDVRPLPPDIAGLVAGPEASAFRIPKAIKFFVSYDYGASVELAKVMSGEINAKLRISFTFFSRTWRKRVVKFSGWSFHFDLIKKENAPDFHATQQTVIPGDTVGATVANGNTTMGLSESQVPLMKLPYLDVPDTPPTGATVPFDAGAVQGMFYDDLCCSKANEGCSFFKTPRCCPGFTCFATDGTSETGFCVPQCRKLDETCSADAPCCPVTSGPPLICGSLGLCQACRHTQQACGTNADCCAGLVCGSDHTCGPPCKMRGESCTTDTDCCFRITADGGVDPSVTCFATDAGKICAVNVP